MTKKNLITVCSDLRMLDWMENGVLEKELARIFAEGHDNTEVEYRLGSYTAISFPEKGTWKLSCPDLSAREWVTRMTQGGIRRYNRQRIGYLVEWVAPIIRENVQDVFDNIEKIRRK